MRVRDHMVLSTAGAALARPWLRRRAIGLWAGGVMVDVDHYVWFCLRERQWSPVAAMRLFNEAHPPQHSGTRLLHSPLVPLVLVIAGRRRPGLVSVAAGIALHIALDAHHEARMAHARAAALERDAFACQACGARAADIETHLRSQPLVMPSYAAHNLVALCDACHEAAHVRTGWDASWN
jgi:hypothetical protein